MKILREIYKHLKNFEESLEKLEVKVYKSLRSEKSREQDAKRVERIRKTVKNRYMK